MDAAALFPAPDRGPFRVSVAPMMDWTDRHCRTFHRLLAPSAWLYTEMVTAQAIRHGDAERLLGRGEEGDRVVLQLGGNDPAELAHAARVGARFGYQEINLNCGCPSDRVREGAFGACLMAQPNAVAEMVRAMQDAVSVPITVKHRIGIDRQEDYAFVRDFVGILAERGGCRRFIVHARNAWLDGLSPRENREIPPLRYEVVHRLARDFPACAFELNGGIGSIAAGRREAEGLHGVMLGRVAYHDPWQILEPAADRTRQSVVEDLVAYLERGRARGVQCRHLWRHILGLYHGQPGGRIWRRRLSDPALLQADDAGVLRAVCAEVEAWRSRAERA